MKVGQSIPVCYGKKYKKNIETQIRIDKLKEKIQAYHVYPKIWCVLFLTNF